MKTVIKEQPQTTPEWKFPCLAKDKSSELVIAATGVSGGLLVGTVINDDNNSYGFGWYDDSWTLGRFTPITTPLTITFFPE